MFIPQLSPLHRSRYLNLSCIFVLFLAGVTVILQTFLCYLWTVRYCEPHNFWHWASVSTKQQLSCHGRDFWAEHKITCLPDFFCFKLLGFLSQISYQSQMRLPYQTAHCIHWTINSANLHSFLFWKRTLPVFQTLL